MVITYHGGEWIKASVGSTTIAFNPISKDSKLKGARFGADVALISLNDKDMNGAEQVAHGEKEPFVISGPGEYEVGNVVVHGFPSVSNYNGTNRPNTIYQVTLEGMDIVFLGALGSKEIDSKVLESIDTVHILFVPIGGDGVLDAKQAHDIAVKLEAHVVVPIHYGEIGEKKALETFLKESGSEDIKPVEKLTIKQKEAEVLSGEVVLLGA